jgi:catechol 2,3-dioxygenase-like lactoylglutathione lyase family enzyme
MAPARMRISATVLGCADPRSLADFYERMLGWTRLEDQPGWVRLQPPSRGTGLSFQMEADYVSPVWPSAPGAQQMMMHLDIAVDDLEAAVASATAAGARLAEYQPRDHVRVMFDPEGHPFCLFTGDV